MVLPNSLQSVPKMHTSSVNPKFLFLDLITNVTQTLPKLSKDKLSRATHRLMVCPLLGSSVKGIWSGTCISPQNDGTKAVTFSPADWVNAISKVELLIGGQVIDEQTSTFSQYIAPSILAQNLTKSTSGFGEVAESKFYPLRFSFCENAQTAIPLIALQYHDVELRITWGTVISKVPHMKCTRQFVHLDTDERTALSSAPQNMLITQTQKAIASGSKTQELNFNHPIKCLVAADGGALSIAADANKMKLQINGTDVADFKYVDPHYTAVTSYYHTAGSKPITNYFNDVGPGNPEVTLPGLLDDCCKSGNI